MQTSFDENRSADAHSCGLKIAAPDRCVTDLGAGQGRACDEILNVVGERPPVSQTGVIGAERIWVGDSCVCEQLRQGSRVIPDSDVEELTTISKSPAKGVDNR